MARPKSELQHIYGVLDFASGQFTDIGDSGNSAIRVNIVASSVAAGGALTDAELRASPVPVSFTGGGDATAANQVTGNNSLSSIDGKTPALGQQLAAASSPVVLTAIQITTLTPPAAITGFALEATQTNRGAKSQITDGTRDGTVKAASTLPAATDTAVVVTTRDTVTENYAVTDGGTLSWTSATPIDTALTIVTAGLSSVAFATSAAGAFSAGTVTFERSVDGGISYRPFYGWSDLRTLATSFLAATIASGLDNDWHFDVSGTTHFRARLSVVLVGAGTLYVQARATSAQLFSPIFATATKGATAPSLLTSTADGADHQALDVHPYLGGVVADSNSGTKSAGTLRVVLATDQPALTNKLLVTPDSVALPANQSCNTAQFGGNAVATGTGAGGVGVPRVTVSNDSNIIVTPPTLTKGTQGATGFSIQDLKDAGRNVTNYFMAAGIAGTNAEVMQSLTGYKGGVAVGATVTPAVVTSGKTYRITAIDFSYQSLATITAIMFRLRANLSGTGVVGSPLVNTWILGSSSAAAGVTTTLHIDFPDGLEFAAGTGIAVGMIGLSTIGAAAASGFGQIAITGYEY